MDAFVVDYRTSPNRFPLPLLDARRAVRFVRANAGEFGLSKDKVLVMGSSAGGHLSALISTYFDAIDENLQNQYGTTLDEYLKTAGQTKEDLKQAALTEQIIPTMDTQMPIYTLIDKEDIEITKEDI